MENIYYLVGFFITWAAILIIASFAVYCTFVFAWRVLWTKIDIGTVWVLIVGKHKKWGGIEVSRTQQHLSYWKKDKTIVGYWKRFLIMQLLKPHTKKPLSGT